MVDVLAFYTASDTNVNKWDAKTGAIIKCFKGHDGMVKSIVVTERKELFVATTASTIFKYDTLSGNIIARFKGHNNGVSCLYYDKPSNTLFSASDDGVIKHWNLNTGETIQSFSCGEEFAINCLHVVGDLLFCGSRVKFVYCWNVKTSEIIRKYGPYENGIMAITVAEGTLFIASGENVYLWDTSQHECLKKITSKKSWIHCLEFVENKLYVAYDDGSIKGGSITTKMMAAIKKSAHDKSTELIISHHQISEFPSILPKCKWLKTINISNNYLRSIPSALSRELYGLESLTLSHNLLESLPQEFDNLVNLKHLDLSFNQFRMLPLSICGLNKLKHLNVSNNQITFLLPFLTKFSLAFLDVQNNPIEDPPPEVWSRGMEAIMEYLETKKLSKELPLSRIKLMFVGNENVGKTSLVNNLIRKTKMFNSKRNIKTLSTDGISINNLTVKESSKKFKVKSKDHKNISFATWDFGGQEVYYTTHQFFLTKNSIYIIAWNVTNPAEDARIEYWLRSIQSKTSDIRDTKARVPIVIVGTHVDSFKGDQKELDNLYTSIKDKYKQEFPNIVTVTGVSSKTGKGIPELKKTLQDIASYTESIKLHLEMKVPESFLHFEQVILRSKTERTPPLLSWREYEQMGYGFVSSDQKLVEYTELLHTLGSLVVFKGKKTIDNIVILDPQWLVDLFATVITTSPNFVRNGIIKSCDLPFIWRDHHKYPPSVHSQMLRLLSNFEIALPLSIRKKQNTTIINRVTDKSTPVTLHLIPSLLPVVQPTLDILWPTKEDKFEIQRHYRFEAFLPVGLFSRFIVRLLNTNVVYCFWKFGVIISDNTKNAFSLIKEDREQKIISIYVRGNLRYITKFMVEIMDSFNRLINEAYYLSVESYAVCCHCLITGQSNPTIIYQETSEMLMLAGERFIKCPNGNVDVRLDQNFPDLCLSYIQKMQVDPKSLKFEEGKSMEDSILGEGGYGLVYKMKWKEGYVAVKQLKQLTEGDLTRDEIKKIYSSFRNEVWLMSGISHPNIVNLLGFSLTGQSLMIMEFIPGGDLFMSLINKKKELNWELRLRILIDIAKGMLFLHSMSPPLIHGDLKCPNVMICEWNEHADIVAKVGDFGLSSRLYEEKMIVSPQLNPFWTAPEILSRSSYNEKADCYSFGVIMWNLLTRKAIFEDKLPWTSEIAKLVCSGERPPIPTGLDVPNEYLSLLTRCWHQYPEERPSFQDILYALEDLCNLYFPDLVKYISRCDYSHTTGQNQINNRSIVSSLAGLHSNSMAHITINQKIRLLKSIKLGNPIKFLIPVGMNKVWAYSEIENVMHVIESQSGQLLKLFKVPFRINSLLYVDAGGQVNDVWGTGDHGILIWDADLCTTRRHLSINKKATALEYVSSAHGDYVWTGRRSQISIWNPVTFECVHLIHLKNSAIPPPKGAFITSINSSDTYTWVSVSNVIYKISQKGEVDDKVFLYHESVIKQIQFSNQDEMWVLTWDNTIYVWSIPSGILTNQIENVKYDTILIDGNKLIASPIGGNSIDVLSLTSQEVLYNMDSGFNCPINFMSNIFNRTIWTTSDEEYINVFL